MGRRQGGVALKYRKQILDHNNCSFLKLSKFGNKVRVRQKIKGWKDVTLLFSSFIILLCQAHCISRALYRFALFQIPLYLFPKCVGFFFSFHLFIHYFCFFFFNLFYSVFPRFTHGWCGLCTCLHSQLTLC